MRSLTVGNLLVNSVLPRTHQITGPITNKGLHDHVVDLARKDPQLYVRTITALKRRGDEIATLEGVSVGLDDIEPQYAARDAILAPALKAIDAAKTPKEREQAVVKAQAALLEYTKKHPGSMTHMALSGARGNAGQLMKIVGTPLATVNPQTGLDSFALRRSYAESLTPAEYWVAVPEVRANEVQARISVSEPGEMAKLLVANMIHASVAMPDCKTHAGISMSLDDGHILDRYTQASHGVPQNTLITPQLVQQLKQRGVHELLVRSPMTCAAGHGVCQMCQGLDEKGQLHPIGRPVGVRSAQALAEPLTQMALSARHGSLTVKETKLAPQGLKGVRQLLEIPKAFRHESVLAPIPGMITSVERAPQGGHYITIEKKKLYAAPELTVRVVKGDRVVAGDALTDGVPNPSKVVNYKGIGPGRAYFVDALHGVYKAEGINLDRRHVELLAKADLNHVRVLDHDPEHPELLRGDIVPYNTFRDAYAKDAVVLSVKDALGRRLGQEIFHFTVGTPITPAVQRELQARGVKEIKVMKKTPNVEFVMKPLAQNPMLHPDWMGRMAHRFLKGTLQQAAQTGETADIHSSHPVPAYVYGAEFRHGPNGSY